MIVQCEHCNTKYRIADDKVKGKGAKVRCANCKNIFTVTPPGDEPKATSTTPQKPAQQAVPPPDSAPAEPADENLSSDTKPTTDQSAPSDKESSGLPPLPPHDASLVQPARSDEPGGEAAFHDSGAESIAPDGQPSEPRSSRPAHELDQTGSFSPPSGSPQPAGEAGFEIEATMRDDMPPGHDPSGTGAQDLQEGTSAEPDPDAGWGNIPIGESGPADQAGVDLGLTGSPDYEPPPPVPVEDPEEPDLFDAINDAGPDTSTAQMYKPASGSSGGGRKAIFILLLLAALGVGGYFAYPVVMEMIQARTKAPEGTLTPAKIQVKALNRTDGKVLYSVRGIVRNESEGNVGLIEVEAQFRNASGEIISRAASYCGNIFEDKELTSLDLKKLKGDLQNELGQSLSNSNISPGQAVPFLVVLDNPPAGISKVTVTISSFKETT